MTNGFGVRVSINNNYVNGLMDVKQTLNADSIYTFVSSQLVQVNDQEEIRLQYYTDNTDFVIKGSDYGGPGVFDTYTTLSIHQVAN